MPSRLAPETRGAEARSSGSKGKSAPAMQPGKQPQGSLAAITKLTVKLVMEFSLRESDFPPRDATWGSEAYDPVAILRAYYRDGSMTRFQNRFPKAFGGAMLTLRTPGAPSELATLKDDGKHTFGVAAGTGVRTLTLEVTPRSDRMNPTGRPAGPALTDRSTSADFFFRPFEVKLEIDADGALVTGKTTIDLPSPAHARVFSEKGNGTAGSELVIDWRPDFIHAHASKRSARKVGSTATPVNPFDASLTRAQQATALPALVIHQTTRREIGFLFDFVGPNGDSIHYAVDLDGFAVKTMDEHYASGHAGPSMWKLRPSVNEFSVGIETVHSDRSQPTSRNESGGTTFRRFFTEQLVALARISGELQGAFPIPRGNVVGHVEVRTGTETRTLSRDKVNCPGHLLDWKRLEDLGGALAPLDLPVAAPRGREAEFTRIEQARKSGTISPGTKSADVLTIKQLLFDIGYSVSATPVARERLTDSLDEACREAVRAFQTRHLAGQLRSHRMFPQEKSTLPLLTTLDNLTITTTARVWWGAQNDAIRPPVAARSKPAVP